MSAKSEHLREFAEATRRWALSNADFAEASDHLAELFRISAGHIPDHLSPSALRFQAFADMLNARATQARDDALEIAPMSADLERLADENE